MRASSYLKDIVARKAETPPPGIFSVCSANDFVLKSSMRLAKQHQFPLLIESTCNQVNQYGGYMDLTPSQFVEHVRNLAGEIGVSPESIFLGGDHLGPSVWRGENADSAMDKSKELVLSYVRAGYKKLHLDASMPCREDPTPLTREIVASREVQLCEVAQAEIGAQGGSITELVFVLGTEVPSPGGASEDETVIEVSSVEETEENIRHTQETFFIHGLQPAWEQTIAFVVQPGVEFSDTTIHPYNRAKAQGLSELIHNWQNLVFEAHSTDYQTRKALKEMVEDHFAILKVGPALTYAMRGAIFSLAEIEQKLIDGNQTTYSDLIETLDRAMVANPKYWEAYYSADPEIGSNQRKYSYLDRCRYYWSHPQVAESLKVLIKNLTEVEIPVSVIQEHFPDQYNKVIDDRIKISPEDLIFGKISDVIEDYVYACNLNGE